MDAFIHSPTTHRPFSVDIFYALSGRVLLHSYMATAKNNTLVSGMFRRILRLSVPFAIITIVAWKEGQWGWVQYGTQAATYTRSHWLPSPTLGGGVGSLTWSDVKTFINSMFTETNFGLYLYNPRTYSRNMAGLLAFPTPIHLPSPMHNAQAIYGPFGPNGGAPWSSSPWAS